MECRRYPTDLSDEEWLCICLHLPEHTARGRPRIHTLRAILDAVFYVLKSGCPWRWLPREYPPWKTVYDWFRRWRIDGTWERPNAELRGRVRRRLGRDPNPSAAIVDSQSVKSTGVGGSERGFGLGAGKMTAYEEDMRVPLAISGPGVASGGARHLVLNTDLAPTIADLAGATPGFATDGRSGITSGGFRQRFMAENWRSKVPSATGPKPFPAPTNFAVRGLHFVYDRYLTGETEYYDLKLDPFELKSKQVGGNRKENLDKMRMRLRHCRGAECLRAEGG